MIHLGLIGYPLSHSLSPLLHAAALKSCGLEGEYKLYPVALDDLAGLENLAEQVRLGSIDGLNVTIPYKQSILHLVDDLTSSASCIGAVNTLFRRANRLIGDNTDGPGFQTDLKRFLNDSYYVKNALVLGAGGVARAVVFGLLSNGWKVTLAVRKADIEQADEVIRTFSKFEEETKIRIVLLEAEDLSLLAEPLGIIVNATPIGMYPETENSPWPVRVPFPAQTAVYDVVYNPRQTRLVSEARSAGLRATTGLGMLVEQAALSFACWTGQTVSREVLLAAVEV